MALFSVPVASGGVFECSSPQEKVYLLSFQYGQDNRVKVPFIEAFHLALDILEFQYPKGVVITTSSLPKFYSNGFDLQHTVETPRFQDRYFLPLLRRLLM